MLGDSRLGNPDPRHHIIDGPFTAVVEKADDLPPPRLGNGIEDIRGGGDSGHAVCIFQYRNICQAPVFWALHRLSLRRRPSCVGIAPACGGDRMIALRASSALFVSFWRLRL